MYFSLLIVKPRFLYLLGLFVSTLYPPFIWTSLTKMIYSFKVGIFGTLCELHHATFFLQSYHLFYGSMIVEQGHNMTV